MIVLKIILVILLVALGICLLGLAAFGVFAIKYEIEKKKKRKEAELRQQAEAERLARRTPEEIAQAEKQSAYWKAYWEEQIKAERILNPDGIYDGPPKPIDPPSIDFFEY